MSITLVRRADGAKYNGAKYKSERDELEQHQARKVIPTLYIPLCH
jgi:hypothetical protein